MAAPSTRIAGTLKRHQRAVARSLLLAALVVATWPAWRVALMGAEPTLEELLHLVCTPPAWASGAFSASGAAAAPVPPAPAAAASPP